MEEPIQTGKTLGGRYQLGERLGAGGWGSVYAAVQTDLGRKVAIKVLHTSVALAPDGLARFEREAKAAAALGHPNIAQVTDFQANAGEPPFLVMELLTGTTLGATMRKTPKMGQARMAWIAYQMLAGLDVAHRAGIVHRDIKPDNVFLVAMPGVEDYVKLLDFGIAKLSGDTNAHLTSTGTMLGSPAFMAPEQVRTSQVDHRVDLYAVGATLYLALAGRMPYEAETVHSLLLAITEQRPIPLHVVDPSIDSALSALVERAMHKDPAGRFASAGDMRAALEPWLGGMAAHASATAGAPRTVPTTPNTTGAMPAAPHTVAAGSAAPSTVSGGPPALSSGPPLGSPPPGSYPPAPQYGAPPASPHGPPPTPQYGAPPIYQTISNNPHAALPPANVNPNMNAGYAAPAAALAGPAFAAAATPGPVVSPAPAPAKGNGAVVGLLVVVVLLLLVVVGGGGYYLLGRDSGAAAAVASGAPGPATPATGAAPAASVAANGAAASTAGAAGAAGAAAPAVAAAGVKGKPVASGAVAAAPATAAAGAAGVAPAIVPDAGAAAAAGAPKKQFAGTRFNVSGGVFDTFDIDAGRAAINARGGAIGACYAATEFDPPDHQFTNWTFHVDPAGNVTSVGRTTNFELHPKFDACMISALRSVKWPASKTGGTPQISFTARTRDNP